MSASFWKDIKDILSLQTFNVDPDELTHITCGLCNRIIIDACQILCGCKFCRNCIEDYLKDGDGSCPVGESKDCSLINLHSMEDVHEETETNQIIFRLKVKCPENCKYEGELAEVVQHQKSFYGGFHSCNITRVELTKDLKKLDKNSDELRMDENTTRVSEMVTGLIKKVELFGARMAFLEEKLSVSNLETHVWKIDNYCQIRTERNVVYGESFYLNTYGYNMRLAISHFGTEDIFLSVYFQLLRGKYDPVLQWPFAYHVTFSLLSQEDIDNNYVHEIAYPPEAQDMKFYKRPTSDRNQGFGAQKFIDVASFTSSEKYLKHDAFFIKFSVTKA